MGIETALVGMGLSAAAASTVATGLAVAGGVAAGSAMASKPKLPSITAPEAPPKAQVTKNADRVSAMAGNIAAAGPGGASSGNSGTFLTGPSGIDPSTLNLGKNTLLGQ